MNAPRRLPGYVEALCLLALAGFLGYLLTAGNYWMYLNPRFRAISWGCVAVLAGLGAYSLARPPAGATWPRAGLYVLVIALCLVSELGLDRWMRNAGVDATAQSGQEEALPSRVRREGVEYVRINLGELYDIAARELQGKTGLPYAVRGFVRRSPEMDARGEFLLYRTALYCCFADATAVGFRVRPEKGAPLPEAGAWVVAYGRLARDKADAQAAEESLGGSAFSSVQPDWAFLARDLEPEQAPGMGMMYEWRSEEPYAF
ncbi:hypothetical protein NNJEOMEG_02478 [Fundidesulfovibrio magnetotacticus]|uniref:DUF1980 domain-containing protein n=1 Tax=Fundidesulfovibrio magnetotacticus TaxID=2730080 RepID=A0A6V8LVL5_9BACT|nr:DUF1980 domain-containing protein [Fundidesulfovibrio magnetotacticus]GFK94631.1 hypothetical protein NNJEOMEG_02478 [Fundidesulfovibrio magnetotacticus]